MDGKKEGLAHLTPPLVHALLQTLARREAECIPGDAPPQGSLGVPAEGAGLSAVESGLSGADGRVGVGTSLFRPLWPWLEPSPSSEKSSMGKSVSHLLSCPLLSSLP